MKHIQTYEDIQNDPQVGDYVLVKLNQPTNLSMNVDGKNIRVDDYIHNKIGKITRNAGRLNFLIEFEFNTDQIYNWWFKKDEIIVSKKNKEDLEIYLDTNKYNL